MSDDNDDTSSRISRSSSNRPPQTPLRGGRNNAGTPSSRIMTTPRIFQEPLSARRDQRLAFQDETPQGQPQSRSSMPTPSTIKGGSSVGDGVSFASSSTSGLIRPSSVQTPTKFRRPVEVQSAPAKTRRDTTPHKQRRTNASLLHHTPLIAKRQTSKTQLYYSKFRKIRYQTKHYSDKSASRRKSRSDAHNNNNKQDFEKDSYMPRLDVRTVSLTQRCAFEPRPLMSLDEWTRLANQQPSQAIRMSPSYAHLQVLHELRARKSVRQLHFAPSMGQDADLFVDWLDNDSDDKKKINIHDGRYRSIDPIAATRALLPASQSVPTFSHTKTRLPMRSDVGFPNATPDEIQLKQLEIQRETEWEEASPRLAVFVTSDVVESMTDDNDTGGTDDDAASRVTCPEHLEWNGGGLPGMPFAGRPLLQAKERNARHFRRKSLAHLKKFMEPNPYSMLAPPLDASHSPSQGWRPRPYHDRPPGMKYLLACPLEVSFAVGDIEPLVCSLALYTLPRSGKVEKGEAYGKMSEEFWFPAGDWDSDKVHFDGAKRDDGSIDEDILEAWMRRKRKAVFSYDPLALNGGLGSCFLVLQVYHLVRPDGFKPYLEKNTASSTAEDCTNVSSKVREHVDRIFEQHRSQLMSPLCFGFAQVFAEGDEHDERDARLLWPQGKARNMELFVQVGACESQEAFVGRLARLAAHSTGIIPCSEWSSSTSAEVVKTESLCSDVTAFSSQQTLKVSLSRLFRSKSLDDHNVGQGEAAAADDDDNDRACEKTLAGFSKVFVSSLSTDFLQCMLAKPAELEPELNESSKADFLPHMFVDVSGHCAVLFDSDRLQANELQSSASESKRSNLLRLPSPEEPFGYISAAEYQEILYLPPRAGKRYDIDSGLPCQSLVNLLYIYPRLLRSYDHSFGSQFTLRLQVNRSCSSNGDEPKGPTVTLAKSAFHSPAPWTGPAVVADIFTKLQPNDDNDLKSGIFFRDEVKVRLPNMLDGSYSLDITLFAVGVGQGDVELQRLAGVSIPLSTSSSRAETNERTATVIPNGNHRIKLGNFQLHLETRLISTLHVEDPSMALVLRDLPWQSGSSSTPHSYSSISDPDTELSGDRAFRMASNLAKTSNASVASHFEALLFMVTQNLMKRDCSDEEYGTTRSYLTCLFEMLHKVKSQFESQRSAKAQIDSFLKSHIDGLEELTNELPHLSDAAARDESVHSGLYEINQPQAGHSHEEAEADSFREEDGCEQDKRIKRRRARRQSTRHEMRMSRLVDNLGTIGLKFSRVSFGAANKTDRMLLQAESELVQDNLAYYFDDDETVFTAPTVKLSVDAESVGEGYVLSMIRSPKSGFSDNSIVRSGTASSPEELNGGQEFAQRVRTVAQVMLAPCGVGPSTFMPSGTTAASLGNNPLAASVCQAGVGAKDDDTSFLPGSDMDGDKVVAGSTDQSTSSTLEKSCLTESDTILAFKRGQDGGSSPNGMRLYEMLLIQWLQSWSDQSDVSVVVAASADATDTNSATLFEPNRQPACNGEQVQLFFVHMDFFLPMILKSLSLRYYSELTVPRQFTALAVVDEDHMLVLNSFIEMLASHVIAKALCGIEFEDKRYQSFLGALSSAQLVVEFLVGLSGILHPEHTKVLLEKYIDTMRNSETGIVSLDHDTVWTGASLHRVTSSRLLLLHVVESFAVLPYFMALNFPPKCRPHSEHEKTAPLSWLQQVRDCKTQTPPDTGNASVGEQLPHSNWLADLLVKEALSICASSCDLKVADTLNDGEPIEESVQKRSGAVLQRGENSVFQSVAVYAITCVYELIVRRNAMDKRFQSDLLQERVAGLIAPTVLDASISSVHWLSRMECIHKVRVLWMLSIIYILQEASETSVALYVRGLCNLKNFAIHRFIKLLQLCSATFQSMVRQLVCKKFVPELGTGMARWLVQESFNTICATIITTVDECGGFIATLPEEEERAVAGILDLLLQILAMSQSPVTLLRGVGSALQVLEQFGAMLFLDATGNDLQHWARIVLSLMNSTSLSVRSISVDFFISLVGSINQLDGCVDEITLVFATVLSEVAAREIALYSIAGIISGFEDVVKCLWPLRRSIADLEDADDRIDPQLGHILSTFCRACQAILDGVLLEIRLQGGRGGHTTIAGTEIPTSIDAFDADEESLLEAASFFKPETAPMQRVRWLLTLTSLHECKNQWVEAAESLFLAASTITSSLPFLKSVWRPSRYEHWINGTNLVRPDSHEGDTDHQIGAQVTEFADDFLEPATLWSSAGAESVDKMLHQPTMQTMLSLLMSILRNGISFYVRHEGSREHAYAKLQAQLLVIMDILERLYSGTKIARSSGAMARKRRMEDESMLRKAMRNITSEMSKVAAVLESEVLREPARAAGSDSRPIQPSHMTFLVVRISGKKPQRFSESTSIPAFLEFSVPYICRVPETPSTVNPECIADGDGFFQCPVDRFAKPYLNALHEECQEAVVLVNEPWDDAEKLDDSKTYMHIFLVEAVHMESLVSDASPLLCKVFIYREPVRNRIDQPVVIEMKVAQFFPGPLSRQRVLLTTAITATQVRHSH